MGFVLFSVEHDDLHFPLLVLSQF